MWAGPADGRAAAAAPGVRACLTPVDDARCALLPQVPPHECLEQKHGFGFHTLLSKPEIISCTQKVHAECNKVLDFSLLNVAFTKSYTEEEFRGAQDLAALVRFARVHLPSFVERVDSDEAWRRFVRKAADERLPRALLGR